MKDAYSLLSKRITRDLKFLQQCVRVSTLLYSNQHCMYLKTHTQYFVGLIGEKLYFMALLISTLPDAFRVWLYTD